ncbi:hypothetical protein SAMN02745121_08632 [Nannocystis exedens]|uniref:Uncharacterized protein n=1 Tax=Nannocystis exedens TaxID=54 RepID=A0A1I2IIE7_9BACT|nr:hypothetical protein [Nannocystis exedens]PCC68227.1 hypothetical protein NAEX_01237 [Nannocystis exedens]SFF40321.1 hypothetical protein SAMN02745121_08632 [Nannocystis exedens]
MAIIDRHRVARLIELSAAERTLKGPERQLREEDVKLLIKAAYDDATDAARAEFMARVQKMPTSAWPWSAVQAMAPRGGGGGGSLGVVVAVQRPLMAPALLVLIRGQADSADIDSGNRLPDPGAPGAEEWVPLHMALDAWDTQTLKKAIGPLGWTSMLGTTSGQVPKDTGGGEAPAPNVAPSAPSGGAPSDNVPTPQTPAVPATITWRRPAVIAAGAAVAVAAGVAVYSIGQSRSRRELEDMLSRLEAER